MSEQCEKMSDLLSAYIDDELSPGELEAVRSHIESCNICAEEIKELSETRDILRSDSIKKRVPEDLKSRIIVQLEDVKN